MPINAENSLMALAKARLIAADKAHFIKLGGGGEWEAECLRDGVIRFGYRETGHDICLAGDWGEVYETWRRIRGDERVARSDTNQIRIFYEADERSLFITFCDGRLHWCRPSGPVEVLPDGLRLRHTADGWRSTSVGGAPLIVDRLSGHLLKVQMFRGTICRVKAFDYLLRKLNDELSPEVAAAEQAEENLRAAVVGLMRLLTWQDFELLVDLVFANSGWRRIGVVGRNQKTVDLELVLPTTGERAFVQIKSAAGRKELQDYADRFAASLAHERMFFVWHTGELACDVDGVTLIGPETLARMVVDSGLASWLREKVS